ncbi:MAG: ribonuclease H-like domain-containing protein, partial [Thermoplasmata archaeon]|nr:ribonuclease H-like domain-containing protein [Thermoplasmata archaeon]
MIRSTFLHLPGVGPITEAELWRRGVRDWAEFGELPEASALASARGDRVRVELAASERALAERHVEYFASRLPSAEHWRLYPAFRAETAFLDIETTGLSPYEGIVTVVSIHGAGRTRTFVADEDLEELPAYLRKFRLLSTFNGRLFDVPFLAHRFPGLSVPPVHI